MSRLVSAWKDKIYKRNGREFYYQRLVSDDLAQMIFHIDVE